MDSDVLFDGWTVEASVDDFFNSGFGDNDLVSHPWIRDSLLITNEKLAMNEFLLLERIEAFKDCLLRDHKVALRNVRGRGYEVIPPSEQARYAAHEASRYMAKGLSKADKLLTHTRLDALDKDERRRHTDTEVRLASLDGMVRREKRNVFSLFEGS